MADGDANLSVSLTSTDLLLGLKDPSNQLVWRQYVERYRPLLVRYAQKLGLHESDADDVAQQTLASFCRAYQAGQYDRAKGRLRVWMFAIARNQVINWRRRRREREVQIADGSDQTGFFAAISDDGRMEEIWEQQWRDAVLRECLSQVRREVEPRTFEVFEAFALRGEPAEAVAQRFGTTANAVFSAKRRIMRRMRELLPQMEETW